MLNTNDLLNNFRVHRIKENSYIPLIFMLFIKVYLCLYQKYIFKESFICNILFFRCKQLQLTTVRAFFDLIDADTKQVCIFKLKVTSVK